jgi:hypothetical protein
MALTIPWKVLIRKSFITPTLTVVASTLPSSCTTANALKSLFCSITPRTFAR